MREDNNGVINCLAKEKRYFKLALVITEGRGGGNAKAGAMADRKTEGDASQPLWCALPDLEHGACLNRRMGSSRPAMGTVDFALKSHVPSRFYVSDYLHSHLLGTDSKVRESFHFEGYLEHAVERYISKEVGKAVVGREKGQHSPLNTATAEVSANPALSLRWPSLLFQMRQSIRPCVLH